MTWLDVALIPLAVFFGLIVICYAVLPLFIWSQQRFPANPRLRRFELTDLDRDAANYLAGHAADLLALGFDEPTHFQLTDTDIGIDNYLILTVDRAAGTVGSVATAVPKNEVNKHLYCRVAFTNRYHSGPPVATVNLAEPLPLVPPGAVVLQVPSVQRTSDLLNLHRAAVERHAPDGEPAIYDVGGELGYLKEYYFRKYNEEGVRCGLLRHNTAKDEYRFTLIGAYLLTWARLFPAKQIRSGQMRREERRILAEYAAV